MVPPVAGLVTPPSEDDYYQRPVPAAITVTAADLVDGSGEP